MKDLTIEDKERIGSLLDKHSSNEKPVAYVLEQTGSRKRYVMRLEDALNFRSINSTNNERHDTKAK